MESARVMPIAQRSPSMAAEFFARPLQRFLDRPDVTEVLMNRPGEVWVESPAGWERHDVPEMTLKQCETMATAVAAFRKTTINAEHPLLSVGLPTGDRVQFVMAPAVPEGTMSITIRRPSRHVPTLEELDAQGLFKRIVPVTGELQPHERELLAIRDAGNYMGFLKRAVELRKTIGLAGHTGSGKTHVMKALCQAIPFDQRILTIESVPELLTPDHPNSVHLFYTDDEQGLAKVTPKQLLKAALRMRPDRIILTEVRDEECFFFLRVAASGHPGSMTTLHAGTAEEAFRQMALMIRQSPGGATLPLPEIDAMLRLSVDIIVQFGNDGTSRHISQVYYDPERKLRLARGEQA